MARGDREAGPHPVDRYVGRRVGEKRISLGYNQADLGQAIGVTFQQVQKYEKGANRISASKLWTIARFFDVDIGYFFPDLPREPGEADGADEFEQGPPQTRHTIEISSLAPRLSAPQQRLVLDLMQTWLPVQPPAAALKTGDA